MLNELKRYCLALKYSAHKCLAHKCSVHKNSVHKNPLFADTRYPQASSLVDYNNVLMRNSALKKVGG
ncbi:hypothetical protein [Psychromonas ingrahamii]|uniref:hypothetical protein n=1 Tax=Psychromonas ingrahamii TaxID=357794 RepID=UPI00031CE9FD|nr:hypothetical protein [Psychromonas ingrahamii]